MPETAEGYDAHETAKPNEPTFTVQGGDPIGPASVQHWAELARARARWMLDGGRAEFEPAGEGDTYTPTEQDMIDADVLLRKATNAERVVWDMQAYQKGQETRVEQAASVEAGHTLDERKALIRGVTRLNNALAEANDVAEMLAGLNLHRDPEVATREAVELLKVSAQAIDPRRGSERS